MPATQLATSTIAGPPAEAQLDREADGGDVARLTQAIADLRKMGPGNDPVLLERLQTELESAQKVLRAVDLAAAERTAAAGAPISTKALGKIRDMRRKVENLHGATLARMGEAARLREHMGSLKKEIAAIKNSWTFRQDQQEIRSEYLFPRDPEARDHPAPARGGKKTPQSAIDLARLERAVETTTAELTIAAAAQISASQRWESEKAILDGWLNAARSLGAAARAVLDAMPHPGAGTLMPTNTVDFRNGIPGHLGPMIR